jgi:glycosidase
VTDYYGVDARFGTLGDFVEFTHAARERGIRVLADLVVNHTSIDHPWFQAVRASRESKYREYYLWSDEKPENAEWADQSVGDQGRSPAGCAAKYADTLPIMSSVSWPAKACIRCTYSEPPRRSSRNSWSCSSR